MVRKSIPRFSCLSVKLFVPFVFYGANGFAIVRSISGRDFSSWSIDVCQACYETGGHRSRASLRRRMINRVGRSERRKLRAYVSALSVPTAQMRRICIRTRVPLTLPPIHDPENFVRSLYNNRAFRCFVLCFSAFQEYLDCSHHTVLKKCGEETAAFTKDFLGRMSNSLLKVRILLISR